MNEQMFDQSAVDYLGGFAAGAHSAQTELSDLERLLDPDNNDAMDGYNMGLYLACKRLGKDPLDVIQRIDDKAPKGSTFAPVTRRIRVKAAAETQIWNDAVDLFKDMVPRGDELVIPLLPGRTLQSMYMSMRSAFKRRGLEATVKQCTNSRWRYRAQGGWVADHYGKPCLIVIHKGTFRRSDAKQVNFFDHCGGAVVYVNDEPFYGTYVGEEGDKLVFSLIWNDDEKIVKFGKAYCSKSGQYAWIVRQ